MIYKNIIFNFCFFLSLSLFLIEQHENNHEKKKPIKFQQIENNFIDLNQLKSDDGEDINSNNNNNNKKQQRSGETNSSEKANKLEDKEKEKKEQDVESLRKFLKLSSSSSSVSGQTASASSSVFCNQSNQHTSQLYLLPYLTNAANSKKLKLNNHHQQQLHQPATGSFHALDASQVKFLGTLATNSSSPSSLLLKLNDCLQQRGKSHYTKSLFKPFFRHLI